MPPSREDPWGPLPPTTWYSRNASDPFTVETLSFVAAASGPLTLSFNELGNDNIGILLDNVMITET